MPVSPDAPVRVPVRRTSGRRPSATRRRSRCPARAPTSRPRSTNLFAGHNRFHDYAYHLGFTEGNYNLQQSNFGATGPGRDGDPEIGNVQAGALDRRRAELPRPRQRQPDHAQDGVPGITNQYLFQPIAGRVLRPVRRRRLRHLGVRPRVHARDLQPHGRRPRRRADRLPGRGDGRELVRPGRARVPATRTATCRSTAPTRGRTAPYVTGNKKTGHPRLRARRQPAQLLRRRLRH